MYGNSHSCVHAHVNTIDVYTVNIHKCRFISRNYLLSHPREHTHTHTHIPVITCPAVVRLRYLKHHNTQPWALTALSLQASDRFFSPKAPPPRLALANWPPDPQLPPLPLTDTFSDRFGFMFSLKGGGALLCFPEFEKYEKLLVDDEY